MRTVFLLALLLFLASCALQAQVQVSLGTTTGCGSLQGGQTCTLTARVTGASNQAVTWSFSPSVTSATVGAGSAPDATGLSTNTYKAPNFITARQVVTATATSVEDPAKSASAQISLVPVTVTIQVIPLSVTLAGGQTQQFSATVSGTSQTTVQWSINPQVGSIDPNTGLYTAPPTISTAQKVTVTATSAFDPDSSGTATVNLTASPTVTVTVNPAAVTLSNNQTQQFTAIVQNSTPGVTWSISPQTGTIDNNGLYIAPALITGTLTVTVTATSVVDSSKSGTAKITLTTVVDVGVGAPASLVQQFVTSYFRNGFNLLVSLPPLANVKKLGATGYVQEFSDAAKTSGVRLALVTISPTVPGSSDGTVISVVQILSPLYVYYSTVGATTAGYPLMDSQLCPPFDTANNCVYDFFDKGYALFAYANPIATGQTFTIRQAFYTEWTALGGIAGPGRPVDVETAITASTATTATVQNFAFGAVYSISSGINRGKTFGVAEPLYDLYVSQNGPAGALGLPTGEILQVSTGVFRQAFEGGALQYTKGSDPTLLLPVATVGLAGPSGNARTLSLGQTLSVTALPAAANGTLLPDRPVSWSTTNGKVISIQATGQTAILTAVGGGTASVTASSGGITSSKLSLTVLAPCCQIGDGAPQSVQQAFLDAITRNKLSVQVPAPSAAARVGNGYVQMVQSADPNTPTAYLLAQSDQAGTAYVVSGSILTRYQGLGGPSGALGYPASDVTAGGTQLFSGTTALAGSPVRVVSGGVLSKWAALGYETGSAGPPLSDASAFSTLGANSGAQQSFRSGAIFSASEGPRAGSSYYVSGLILTRYQALGAASGDYGMPVSDEFLTGSVHQQNFEGGNLTYTSGDVAAVEHPAPKTPSVIAAPSSIAAGGRARLAVIGFPNNSTIRVSISGASLSPTPDFLVTSTNGAYSWDMAIPLASKSGTVNIHAVDTKGPSSADGTLVVKGFIDNRLQITKVQGDNQTGMPGAVLPQSLRIALKDSSGSPVVGASVVFQASPGAQLSATAAVTDSVGQAETLVRLPAAEGITAVTADAPSIAQSPVSFFARAAASGLLNFPQLVQAGNTPLGHGTSTIAQKGALLTAVASILRFHQSRGELPAPNGTADPAVLNQFLLNDCAVDSKGAPLCDGFLSNPDSGEQVVNLWRAAEFTGGVDVTVLNPTLDVIADRIARGSPLLLSLGLSLNGAPAGGHFVIGIGVSADGSIVIQDPSPSFAKSSLGDYLNGFTAAAGKWKADLRGVVEFTRRSPGATRFMLAAISQPVDLMANLLLDVQSAAGVCGQALDLLDTGVSLLSRIEVCDGQQPAYQLSVGASQRFRAFLTDLAPGGSTTDLSGSNPVTYKASRPQLALALAPQDVNFRADGVVNAATFTASIAPGGIISIFGTGLALNNTTTVDIDGADAQVLAATPFQINAVLPSNIAAGPHTLTVHSPYGSAQQTITLLPVAPAIFEIGTPAAGAILNQNSTLNSAVNPLPRGQVLVIYATGLGAVVKQGQLSIASSPVTVILNGQELPAAFAGLAPGSPGEYQVNVLIPATTPPGSGIFLTLKQGGQLSNTVTVALQ